MIVKAIMIVMDIISFSKFNSVMCSMGTAFCGLINTPYLSLSYTRGKINVFMKILILRSTGLYY
jgi:hypothetical protein